MSPAVSGGKGISASLGHVQIRPAPLALESELYFILGVFIILISLPCTPQLGLFGAYNNLLGGSCHSPLRKAVRSRDFDSACAFWVRKDGDETA
jgi:hypothetical protein